MRSIKSKFAVAFALTGILGAVIVAFIARGLTYQAFTKFNIEEIESETTETLTQYYRQIGSWDGVENIFDPDQPENDKASKPFIPFLIADDRGDVVLSVPPEMLEGIISKGIPEHVLDNGKQINIDDRVVGTVYFFSRPEGISPSEIGFLRLIDKSTILAAVIGIVLGILLSVFLTRSFTKPIQDLSQAALEISRGNLGKQVEVTTKDELGILGNSFNTMSAELERSDRLRRQMTADIAHELRNPMTVLGVHLEGMKDGTLKLTSERINTLYGIHQQMHRIIDDLRDLSLADANKLPLYKSATDPVELLNLVVQTYAQMAEEKKVSLSYIKGEDLPLVNADPLRLSQVIGNLVHNAIENTSAGGSVELSAEPEGEWMVFRVTDTGIGIPEEELANIFLRFYRVDAARQTESGNSGLGLAIARSLTEAHGGKITVESKVGEGSTFSVYIPIEKA
jgi:signal transduction histidine kinase